MQVSGNITLSLNTHCTVSHRLVNMECIRMLAKWWLILIFFLLTIFYFRYSEFVQAKLCSSSHSGCVSQGVNITKHKN